VAAWLARARADAEARHLPALVPLLEGLARSTSALRDADALFAGPDGPAPDTDEQVHARDAGDAAE
jgi:hypothetical protein